MQTIRIRVKDSIYDKVLWLLSKFSKDEIEIIQENANYDETKAYLERELSEVKEDQVDFVSIDELDKELELILKNYENRL